MLYDSGRWLTRVASDGTPFRVWRRAVPRVPDFLLDSVIYLYESEEAADRGDSAGGSGFLVGVPLRDDNRFSHWDKISDMEWMQGPNMFGVGPWAIYAVTARHVIGEGCPVIRINSATGPAKPLPLAADDWIPHPDGDDVTVCPLELDPALRVGFVPLPFVLTSERLYRRKIGPGDDVFFIGRFIGRDGKERNTPTVRFGNLAMMPFEPIFNRDTGISQQSFLVEMRSLPGYSGSPVFVYSSEVEVEVDLRKVRVDSTFSQAKGPATGTVDVHKVFLLGMDWCHIRNFAPVLESDTETRHPEGLVVPQNSGMAGVVPAWKLLDILLSKELEEVRKKQRGDHEAKTANVALDSAPQESPGTLTKGEFDRALRKVTRRVEPPERER